MELHQLQYFESVSRHLHFTRAAEELNVAQTLISDPDLEELKGLTKLKKLNVVGSFASGIEPGFRRERAIPRMWHRFCSQLPLLSHAQPSV